MNRTILVVNFKNNNSATDILELESKFDYYIDYFNYSNTEDLVILIKKYSLICLIMRYPALDEKTLNTIEQINAKYPTLPVIVLLERDDDKFSLSSIRSGATDAFFYKKKDFDKLCELINKVSGSDRSDYSYQQIKFIDEQKLLRVLMDNIPDSIYFKDRESRFVKVNNATLAKFRLKSEREIIHKTDMELFGFEHASDAYKDEQKIIKTGAPLIGKVEKEDWPNGKFTWVSTTKLPLYDDSGRVIGTYGITRDITGQKLAEQNYLEAKERAELIFRIVPSAIFMIDKDRIVTGWNKMAENITGYKASEILGKKCTLFALEPCVEQCGLFSGNNAKKPQMGIECMIKTKGGDIKNVIKNVDYIRDADGNITGGIESFIDITEIKRGEERLSESEKKFRLIWENINEGMRITDADGRIIMVNDAYSTMVKKSEEELIGKVFTEVYHTNGRKKLYDDYIPRFKDGNIVPRYEAHYDLWNGQNVWYSVFETYIDYGHQKLLLSVFRDITESKKSEIIQKVIYEINNAVFEISDFYGLMQKLHEILKQLVKVENFFIATYDKDTNKITIPYEVDEIDKQKGADIPIEGSFTGYVIKTGESLLVTDKDVKSMVDEGKVKLIGTPSKVWLGVPICVEHEVIGVVVIQDYHDRDAIRVEEQMFLEYAADQIGIAMDRILSRERLVESERKLREANDAKDKFFSIISHDLRNPFISINSFVKMLSEDFDNFSTEEVKEYLALLNTTSHKTLNLLDNLLTWSRSQRGAIAINYESLNLLKNIEFAIEAYQDLADSKDLSIKIEVPNKIQVKADRFMIETIIRNLVSNAIKFTPEKGTISILAESNDEEAVISVVDTGTGMNDKIKSQLFTNGNSITSKGTQAEVGTGLGLRLCYDFVKKLDGKIWVESKEGEGSKFSFTIPLCPDC